MQKCFMAFNGTFVWISNIMFTCIQWYCPIILFLCCQGICFVGSCLHKLNENLEPWELDALNFNMTIGVLAIIPLQLSHVYWPNQPLVDMIAKYIEQEKEQLNTPNWSCLMVFSLFGKIYHSVNG